MTRLKDCDRKHFQLHGVVCLRQILAPMWIALLQHGFRKNIAVPGPYACFYTASDEPGLFRDDYCNWQRIGEYERVIRHSPLAAIAGALLEAQEIRFFHEHIFLKQKGTLKKTPWHQDLPYYCVDGDQGISFWIPLTPIDASNTIEFIAGTHRLNKLFRPRKFNGIDTYALPEGLYAELPDFDNNSAFQKLSWTMELGDAIAFDFRTIHGNSESDKPSLCERHSIALRFLGENMRYSMRTGEKSPPFPELALKPGSKLEHELFPIVWSA